MKRKFKDKEFLRDLDLSAYDEPRFLSKILYLNEEVKKKYPEVSLFYCKFLETTEILPEDYPQAEEVEKHLKELFYDEERYKAWAVKKIKERICEKAMELKKEQPLKEVLKIVSSIAQYNELLQKMSLKEEETKA